jgi:phosphoribosyl-AMP cyclohydrolase
MKRSIVPGEEKTRFAPRVSTDQIEEGRVLAPKFDTDGLIMCVVTDAWSGEVLMVAHMNADALARTIETAEAWYYSRSRQTLWRKGEQSGHTQRVVEMRVDCDQDALWMRVEQTGAGACHTGRTSCFYRAVRLGEASETAVVLDVIENRTFDPRAVYKNPK